MTTDKARAEAIPTITTERAVQIVLTEADELRDTVEIIEQTNEKMGYRASSVQRMALEATKRRERDLRQVAAALTARDAEAEGLRTQLAEARKYGAPVAGAEPLAHVKNPCTKHNAYWTTASGACMACRADEAEGLREALRGLYNAVRGGDKTAGVTMDDALEDAKAAIDAAGGAK